MNINRTGMHTLFAASVYGTALAVPAVRASLPAGVNGTAAIPSPPIDCAASPAVRLSFGGTGSEDDTINFQAIGWTLGDGVWVPKVLAKGVLTLSATTMAVAGLDTAATLLVDTITDTIGLDGVIVRSPGGNRMADITIWPGNCQSITVETDLATGATAASCYFEMLDEASASTGYANLLNAAKEKINPATLEGQGGDVAAGSIGAIGVGDTTTVILAASSLRRSVTLTNLSTSVVYLAFGKSAVSGQGVPLAAAAGAGSVGGSYDVSGAMSKLAINGISDGAAKSVAFQVGSLS